MYGCRPVAAATSELAPAQVPAWALAAVQVPAWVLVAEVLLFCMNFVVQGKFVYRKQQS